MNTNQVSAVTIRRLMRQNRITIGAVASAYNISLSRVRQVRKLGGPWDWPLMITSLRRAA